MNFYDRLRQDNSRILSSGFTLAVVFTDPSGETHSAGCFFSDIGLSISADGLPVLERKITMTTHLIAEDGTVQFTESAYPNGSGWKLSFTYNGTAFRGEVLNSMFDRSFGSITLNAGKIKVVGN